MDTTKFIKEGTLPSEKIDLLHNFWITQQTLWTCEVSHTVIGWLRYLTTQVCLVLKHFVWCRFSVLRWDHPSKQGCVVPPQSAHPPVSALPFRSQSGNLHLSLPLSHDGYLPLNSTSSISLNSSLNSATKPSSPHSLTYHTFLQIKVSQETRSQV